MTELAAGVSAATTVTATRTGYTTTTATASASALEAGTTPALSTPVRTADGYSVSITNYDPLGAYTAANTAGTAVVDSFGVVTVTGLAAGVSAATTVTATWTGYTTTTATISASALAVGTTQGRHPDPSSKDCNFDSYGETDNPRCEKGQTR